MEASELLGILTATGYLDLLLSDQLTPQALAGLTAHEIQTLHDAISGFQKHLKPLEIAAGRHELNA